MDGWMDLVGNGGHASVDLLSAAECVSRDLSNCQLIVLIRGQREDNRGEDGNGGTLRMNRMQYSFAWESLEFGGNRS